jgi:hypothetical protein
MRISMPCLSRNDCGLLRRLAPRELIFTKAICDAAQGTLTNMQSC